MSDTIALQTSGAPALGSDEFLINRSGTDFKLTLTEMLTNVTALLASETAAREAADTSLTNTKLGLAGGTLTGLLTLSADPTNLLHAATKQYVDAADSLLLSLGGGVMTGFLTLSGDPTSSDHASTKNYTDASSEERWKNAINISCVSFPNYPVSLVGYTYRVSEAGKIGGASGKVVQVDDLIYCHTADPLGGSQAAVGANYSVLQANLVAASQTESGYVMISTPEVNKVGTDDTTAVSPLGLRTTVSELVPNYSRIITANTTVTVTSDTESQLYLLTGSGTGTVAVTLPEIGSIAGNKKITITFKDAGNNANINNVTITRSGADLIDGDITTVINEASGKVTLVNDEGTNWYTV